MLPEWGEAGRVSVDQACALLGVAPDADPETLRRAYLRAVKLTPPERDPEGFMRVRAAYELLRGDWRPEFIGVSAPIGVRRARPGTGRERGMEGLYHSLAAIGDADRARGIPELKRWLDEEHASEPPRREWESALILLCTQLLAIPETVPDHVVAHIARALSRHEVPTLIDAVGRIPKWHDRYRAALALWSRAPDLTIGPLDTPDHQSPRWGRPGILVLIALATLVAVRMCLGG